MCGIAGYLCPRGSLSPEELQRAGRAMSDTLRHRGPDGEGVWVDARLGLALSHRRLAIIDLSAQGSQPMISASGRFVIIFNGEIYNHRELRDMLAAVGAPLALRGHSDTEILLEAVERWGFRAAIERTNGMFAVAAWDQLERRLWLARDRLGEKPLYYYHHEGRFLFASELKALRVAMPEAPEVDRLAMELYLRYGYVPAPRSIWRHVSKLSPGCLLCVSAIASQAVELDGPQEYWSLPAIARREAATRRELSEGEIDERFASLLRDSARLRTYADVPVGAFLSGGIDSACVVAALQSASSGPVRTFTVGFEDALFDERSEARETARYLGTDHSELTVGGAEFFALVRRLPVIYDEPFAEASQIPSCAVCSAAAQQVKVCVSGDGGDELFGGYMRYQTHQRLWRMTRWARLILGANASSTLAGVAGRVPRALENCAAPFLRRFAPGYGTLSEAISRLGRLSSSTSEVELYRSMMSLWQRSPVIGGGEAVSDPDWFSECAAQWQGAEYLMLLDQLTYLPDSNLTKMDRAGMQASMEVRVPLLDHRIAEFSWQLRASDKLRHATGKLPLRRFLAGRVPSGVLDRPKRGFAMPMAGWLRSELKPWAEDLIHSGTSDDLGLDRGTLDRAWSLHQSGKHDFSSELWSALVLMNWAVHKAEPQEIK